ncbi:hypothetical protein J437_LFUL006692, partial [Ladona fulva]
MVFGHKQLDKAEELLHGHMTEILLLTARNLLSCIFINIASHNCACLHENLYLPNSECCCPKLQNACTYKYLGLTIDQHFKWDSHIYVLCNKLRRTLFTFYHLHKILPSNLLRILYFALFESYLRYGIVGWGMTAK